MVLSGEAAGVVLLVGRILFGGVLAFTGINHFMETEQMAGYAASKGLPAPTVMVVLSGLLLVAGGAGIVIGVYPLLAAVALAVFFLVATPMMHDFWRMEGEQQQQEMNHFLKNVALLGGALAFAFVAINDTPWMYAVNVGL